MECWHAVSRRPPAARREGRCLTRLSWGSASPLLWCVQREGCEGAGAGSPQVQRLGEASDVRTVTGNPLTFKEMFLPL